MNAITTTTVVTAPPGFGASAGPGPVGKNVAAATAPSAGAVGAVAVVVVVVGPGANTSAGRATSTTTTGMTEERRATARVGLAGGGRRGGDNDLVAVGRRCAEVHDRQGAGQAQERFADPRRDLGHEWRPGRRPALARLGQDHAGRD